MRRDDLRQLLQHHALLRLVTLWAAWAVLIYAFQHLVVARLDLARPDRVLPWTAAYTGEDVLSAGPAARTGTFADFYRDLRVAWDSGYYLSIATRGYDDPDMHAVTTPDGRRLTNNYAFLPLYPLLIRGVAFLLRLVGVGELAGPIHAGLLVSLLGALGAMLALADLARSADGEGGAMRAAFYLLVFPTGFFLAQVYTEGLFAGLALGALALIGRRRWLAAAILASLATLTRAIGIVLAVSLLAGMLQEARARPARRWHITRHAVGATLAPLLPVAVFLLWRASPLGKGFAFVEEQVFGRRPLALRASWVAWRDVALGLGAAQPETRAYYFLEFTGLGLGLAACFATLRRNLPVSLFGLGVLAVSVLSATPQSMVRYMLSVPPIFLLLARLGHHEALDRAWSLGSVLLLGLLLTLFSFDLWVG